MKNEIIQRLVITESMGLYEPVWTSGDLDSFSDVAAVLVIDIEAVKKMKSMPQGNDLMAVGILLKKFANHKYIDQNGARETTLNNRISSRPPFQWMLSESERMGISFSKSTLFRVYNALEECGLIENMGEHTSDQMLDASAHNESKQLTTIKKNDPLKNKKVALYKLNF